jgi:hypothetical protein
MLALRNSLYHCFLNPAAFLDRRRGEEGVPLTGLKDTDDGDPRSRTAGERHLKKRHLSHGCRFELAMT